MDFGLVRPTAIGMAKLMKKKIGYFGLLQSKIQTSPDIALFKRVPASLANINIAPKIEY